MLISISLVILIIVLYFLYRKKLQLKQQVSELNISDQNNLDQFSEQTKKIQFSDHARKSAKPMMWISTVSMSMIFAGLTSAYIVRRADGNWLNFELPFAFYISTILIVSSSITLIFAKQFLKRDKIKLAFTLILVTFLLGLGFLGFQFLGWKTLVDMSIYFAGTESNASGSFFYAITGMHILHLLGGLIALFIVLVQTGRSKYSSENMLGFELSAIFWHFLDLLWLYLFIFLLYIR